MRRPQKEKDKFKKHIQGENQQGKYVGRGNIKRKTELV